MFTHENDFWIGESDLESGWLGHIVPANDVPEGDVE